MADIKISELSQAESLSLSDLMESAIPYNGGFQSRRMTIAQLSNYLENSVLHNALDTTAKNIIGAINEIVLDLANYYTKSETYSKAKIDELIAGVSGLHFLVVQTLPVSDIDPNTIYLVPKQDVGTQDIYDEFIYIVEEAPTPSHWEKIGTTEIDLSDYVTDTELATELLNYVTTSALNTTLQSYATTSAMTTALADKVDKVSGKGLSTEDYTTTEKNKLNGIASGAEVNVQSDWNATSGDAFIKNKPTIPTALADLTDDSTHRVVTDSQITSWDNKSGSDTNVTQTNNSTDTYLPLLLANSTTSPETTTVKKSENLKANPSNGYLDANAIRIHSSVSGSETKFARLYSENTVDRRYKLPVDKANGSVIAIIDDIKDATLSIQLNGSNVDSFSANASSNVTANIKAAVNYELMTEDLNDVKTVGFYVGKKNNTCANKPSGFNQFGLYVIRTATSGTGNYYKQILVRPSGDIWSRVCEDGTWSAWSQDITTDTTYSAGTGIAISSSNEISNSGVRSVTTGTAFGSLSVNTGGTSADASLELTGELQSNEAHDLNDYKTSGIYYFRSDYVTPTNIPAWSNGILFVIASHSNTTTGKVVKQVWMRHGTNNSNDHHTYLRSYNGSSWSDWHRIITQEGGTITGVTTFNRSDGTTSAVGDSSITLGNSTKSGTDGNSRGRIQIYGADNHYINIRAQDTMSNNYGVYLPSARGILALDYVWQESSVSSYWINVKAGSSNATHVVSSKCREFYLQQVWFNNDNNLNLAVDPNQVIVTDFLSGAYNLYLCDNTQRTVHCIFRFVINGNYIDAYIDDCVVNGVDVKNTTGFVAKCTFLEKMLVSP
ncbi:MAG: hypothetical protein IJH64_00275 [Oscillospiraceae bacterium]|nr:hypothetical protein [Oscillospiraceae bacterium]